VKKYFRVFLSFLTLVIVLSGSMASAQAGTLAYDTPSTGEINGDNIVQTWSFSSEGADRIRIDVERISGDLLPEVILRAAGGEQIAVAGTDATGARASIERADLPRAGAYEVLVQRYDGAAGMTTGMYSIEVTLLGVSAEHPTNEAVVAELVSQRPTEGEIRSDHWLHLYTYTAPAADVIAVEARRLSGGLAPYFEIWDDTGAVLATGWTRGGYDYAVVDSIELPGAGVYTIALMRAGALDGGSSGRYALELTLLGAGDGSALLAQNPAQIVDYNTPVQGAISARWHEDWAFNATSADTVTFSVTSLGVIGEGDGNLLPEVLLFDVAGEEIAHGWPTSDGISATISRFQLPSAGEYRVRVTRSSYKTGGTEGGYRLTATLHGLGADNAALRQTTGSLQLGVATTGEIGARWEQRWQFDGRASLPVIITVTRLEGTLYPVLEILNENGEVLTGSWYDATRTMTRVEFTPPADGSYIIRVLREGDQNGWTVGSYRLDLVLRP
jgi:hypothetical protein